MHSYFHIVFFITLVNLFDLSTSFMHCPAKCVCEDERVICTNSNFNVVPIMLNPWLKELYIGNNQIKKMTPLNSVYMDLEVLDLSNNQIDYLEDNIFLGLSKIKVLKLNGNRIANLSRNSLKGLDTLETLILSNNQINEISVNTFTHLKNLKRLDLSNNLISHLDGDVFSGQLNLVNLDISDNKLKFDNLSIEQNPIKSEYLQNLVSLNLSGNLLNRNLTSSNSPFIQQTNELGEQQLTYLQLKGAQSNDQNAQYPRFNLVNNRRPHFLKRKLNNNQQPVAERRTVNKKWANLRELDLSDTQISLIENDALAALSQLQILKLRNNRISEFQNNFMKDLHQLKSLDISHNPIIQLHKNTFNDLQQLEILNITGCTDLQNINDEAFNGLSKLQRLDIAWCPKLKTVNPSMFQPLGNLKQLFLRGNALESLDSTVLNYAISLEILDIRNNPLYCDCNLKWLINVLYMYANQSSFNLPAYLPFFEQQQQLRLELSQVNCAGPVDLTGKLIYELTNDQLHCVDLRLFIFIFTGVFVTVAIVLLVVLTVWMCVRYGNGKFSILTTLKNIFIRTDLNKKEIGFKTNSSNPVTSAQRTLHKLLGTGNLYQTDKTFNVSGIKPEFTWLPNKTTGRNFSNNIVNSKNSNYGNTTSLIFNGSNTSTICPSMITTANSYFSNQRSNQRKNDSTVITNLNGLNNLNGLQKHRLAIHQTATVPMDTYDYLHHNYASLYETLNPPEHYASSISTTTLSSSIVNQSQNSNTNLVVPNNNLVSVTHGATAVNNLRNQSIRYQHPCIQALPCLQTWNPSFQENKTAPMINNTPKS